MINQKNLRNKTFKPIQRAADVREDSDDWLENLYNDISSASHAKREKAQSLIFAWKNNYPYSNQHTQKHTFKS